MVEPFRNHSSRWQINSSNRAAASPFLPEAIVDAFRGLLPLGEGRDDDSSSEYSSSVKSLFEGLM